MSDLKGTVLRARANPGALLKGFEVCLAAHVQPPINTLSAIVRSAGGDVSHLVLFSLMISSANEEMR